MKTIVLMLLLVVAVSSTVFASCKKGLIQEGKLVEVSYIFADYDARTVIVIEKDGVLYPFHVSQHMPSPVVGTQVQMIGEEGFFCDSEKELRWKTGSMKGRWSK
ncbi:hypothetical protein IID24_03185 [Patescibacteria group bacterium]|nr:hypothetical protein [Patescibacteria group bacterium]